MKLNAASNAYRPYVGRDGCWAQVITPPDRHLGRAPALFLERDGVLVEDVGYIGSSIDVKLMPGAGEVISAANRLGLTVVVVTAQGGIGRGVFDWSDFAVVQERLYDLLAAERAHIDAVFATPFHPKGSGIYRHADHPSRMPNAGMFRTAALWLGLDMASSWVIGAHAADLEAGRNARMAGGMHVLTGYGDAPGERETALALARSDFRVITGQSIKSAIWNLPFFAEEGSGLSLPVPPCRPAHPGRAMGAVAGIAAK